MSNGHLSCMFILVHRIAYKKILQFSELQDFFVAFHQTFVELEGFEPSSKRGTNVLSTCLVSAWL